MSDDIHNGMKYIDSQDLEDRMRRLKLRLAERFEDGHDGEEGFLAVGEERELLQDELDSLTKLAVEARRYSGSWASGALLIRDDHFEDYAREYADDVHGNGVSEGDWPFDFIDWEAAADSLRTDYREVDFDGQTYLVR